MLGRSHINIKKNGNVISRGSVSRS